MDPLPFNWEHYVSEMAYAVWTKDHAGHVEFQCTCHETGCMFCDGGLFACVRCDAFEGGTPSECPGVKMTYEEQQQVYSGIIDYRFGQWQAACTVVMMHLYLSPPKAPPGYVWDWDLIDREIVNRPYEPRTIDA